MDLFFDNVFHGLFTTLDPLGMILRTLMSLLSDSLAQLVSGMYTQLFQITTVDFSTEAVGSIWRITTGLSVGLATILLILAAFRSMLAQSNKYLLQAFPGIVLAILGPQAAALLLPFLAAGFTSLAEGIVATATPDLAQSMRLLAGVGSNPIYEGLGLVAPLIAALLLFGMGTVFFVLLFCMAGAVVLFVLSPFAFAGLVMSPTRVWFTKWATAMFALLFAKVPIAILLALSVSLFANSKNAGTAQAFVNAGAGLILGMGALLSPLLAYSLFSFMGTVATRPAGVPSSPGRAASTGYYGMQMGKSGVNAMRTAGEKFRSPSTTGGSAPNAVVPHEPSAAQRSQGAVVAGPANRTSGGGNSGPGLPIGGPAPPPVSAAGGASAAPTAGAGASAASAGSAATAGTAAAAGAATAGVGAAVVLGAAAAKKAAAQVASKATSTAEGLASSANPPSDGPSGFGSPDSHRVD
ncbi:MAG: hypothetical protein Q7L55_05035 [Actinomycetota bacterium]|nr:hypothetical protein [Actinomycetota bacterium]